MPSVQPPGAAVPRCAPPPTRRRTSEPARRRRVRPPGSIARARLQPRGPPPSAPRSRTGLLLANAAERAELLDPGLRRGDVEVEPAPAARVLDHRFATPGGDAVEVELRSAKRSSSPPLPPTALQRRGRAGCRLPRRR